MELPDISRNPLTDASVAGLFADVYHNAIMADTRRKKEEGWLIWDGKRWARANVNSAVRAMVVLIQAIADAVSKDIREAVEAADVEKVKAAKLRYVQALALQSSGRVNGAVSLAWALMTPEMRDFDVKPYLLNVNNGTLDLQTFQLRPHDPADLLTKLVPINYIPRAPIPRKWLEGLNLMMDGSADMVRYLQRCIGYTLTGSTGAKVMFVLHGEGNNGKSTFTHVLTELLGGDEYSMAAPADTFMSTKLEISSEAPNATVARTVGARAVILSESQAGDRISGALIKRYASGGGDKIVARHPHGQAFDFVPEAKVWLATNHIPLISAEDGALWRRIRLIPFLVNLLERLPPEKRLTQEQAIAALMPELEGILAWAVEGCREYQRAGLQDPDQVVTAGRECRASMDRVQEYIDTALKISQSDREPASTPTTTLYAHFREWHERMGYGDRPPNQNRFSKSLMDKNWVIAQQKMNGVRKQVVRGLSIP